MAQVVVPPFDVISREEQQNAYDCHPNNMIRLELNKGGEAGSETDSPHLRAAHYLSSWRADRILVQDDAPALYLTATDFPIGRRQCTRLGFIAAVRLEPFEKKVVLPHEKTFSRVRSERLALMKACHANFSPIFGMYSDPHNHVLAAAVLTPEEHPPEIDFVDGNGHRHRLWRLSDPGLQRQITDRLKTHRLYIADGHHRYETAMAYRRWREETSGPLPSDHPANFVMMYLTGMETDGMVILPAHRLLKPVPAAQRRRLLEAAPEYFDIVGFSPAQAGGPPDLPALQAAMAESSGETRIGVVLKDQRRLVLLRLRDGVMERLYAKDTPAALMKIDATVLTRLVFMKLLFFDRDRLDDHELIGYASTVEQAVDRVQSGEYDIGFLLNPTPIEQVKQVADAGLIMPRKATYFYPKVLSGLVVRSLQPV